MVCHLCCSPGIACVRLAQAAVPQRQRAVVWDATPLLAGHFPPSSVSSRYTCRSWCLVLGECSACPSGWRLRGRVPQGEFFRGGVTHAGRRSGQWCRHLSSPPSLLWWPTSWSLVSSAKTVVAALSRSPEGERWLHRRPCLA